MKQKSTHSRLLVGTIAISLAFLLNAMILLATVDGAANANEAWHNGVRYTVRFSCLIFAAVFVLSAFRNWLSPQTYQVALSYRPYLGLAFAAAHAVHLYAVWGFLEHNGYLPKPAALLMDIVALAFLVAMSVTTFSFVRKKVNPKTWTHIHKFGIYAIWFTLFVPFSSRVRLDFESYPYWMYAIFLFLILTIRLRSDFRNRHSGRMISD